LSQREIETTAELVGGSESRAWIESAGLQSRMLCAASFVSSARSGRRSVRGRQSAEPPAQQHSLAMRHRRFVSRIPESKYRVYDGSAAFGVNLVFTVIYRTLSVGRVSWNTINNRWIATQNPRPESGSRRQPRSQKTAWAQEWWPQACPGLR
jgi:hypothetical protein